MPQVFLQFFDLIAVLGQFNAFFPFPRSWVDGDCFLIQIDRYRRLIGFDGDLFSNHPRRCGVTITIKPDRKIFIDLDLAGFSAVGQQRKLYLRGSRRSPAAIRRRDQRPAS